MIQKLCYPSNTYSQIETFKWRIKVMNFLNFASSPNLIRAARHWCSVPQPYSSSSVDSSHRRSCSGLASVERNVGSLKLHSSVSPSNHFVPCLLLPNSIPAPPCLQRWGMEHRECRQGATHPDSTRQARWHPTSRLQGSEWSVKCKRTY